MPQPQIDFTAARSNMVDCQIRPNRITDPRLLDAMRSLPREQFLPPELAASAYVDEDVPLGRGRVLMEPLVIARLVQAGRVRNGDRALVVGAGTGYGSALLAACGASVTALEEDDALMAIALRVLPRVAPAVRLVDGRLSAGLLDGGPWQVILIEGAVQAIPEQYAVQLAPGGRLVTVITAPDAPGGRGILAEPVAGTRQLRARDLFDCATPLIPSLRPAAAFVF